MGVYTAHSVSFASKPRTRRGHPPACHENFTYHPNLPLHACQDVRLNLFAVVLSAPVEARRPSRLMEVGHGVDSGSAATAWPRRLLQPRQTGSTSNGLL